MNKSAKAASLPERWEVGSEFHWMGLPPAPFIAWPEPAAWYLLGRHAVVDLLHSFPARPRRLWVPRYFCFDIVEYWKGLVSVALYDDNPRRAEPDWSTLNPSPEDVVIAVNYFGVRKGTPWRCWRESNECVLLEDHSHDPVSGWAQCSTADYAFCSLRKTLPVPDGAILWSPRGLQLPSTGETHSSASALKLAAMIWKSEYLKERAGSSVKSVYREWQRAGEHAFDIGGGPTYVTPYSRSYLACGVPVAWRRQRTANVRRLLSKLKQWPAAKPLFTTWPSDAAPFGAVFQFPTLQERNAAHKVLEKSNVYCAVHWPALENYHPAVRPLADTLLTFPADQRYGRDDMDRVAFFCGSHITVLG